MNRRTTFLRRAAPRFSLFALFAVLTAACLVLGMRATRMEQQKRAIAILSSKYDGVTWDTTDLKRPHDLSFISGSDVVAVNFVNVAPSADDIGLLGSFPSLKTLRFMLAPIGDEQLTSLPRLPAARTLVVSGPFTSTVRLSDHSFVAIARAMPNLENLSLHNVVARDEGLEELAGLHQLTAIDFDGLQVTGQFLVGFRNSKLRTLSIENSLVDDRSCEHLKTMAALESITLSSPNLSRNCLAPLGEIRGLKQLTVWMPEGNLTVDDESRLRHRLEDCMIILGPIVH